MKFVDSPFFSSFHHRASLTTVSKAFCKSTNNQYTLPLFRDRYLSIVVLM
jgi:hypothetical protein